MLQWAKINSTELSKMLGISTQVSTRKNLFKCFRILCVVFLLCLVLSVFVIFRHCVRFTLSAFSFSVCWLDFLYFSIPRFSSVSLLFKSCFTSLFGVFKWEKHTHTQMVLIRFSANRHLKNNKMSPFRSIYCAFVWRFCGWPEPLLCVKQMLPVILKIWLQTIPFDC